MSTLNKIKFKESKTDIKSQISFYVDNGLQVMLWGPSGVGKSRRVEQADPEYTFITLRNGILPEEVLGLTVYPSGKKNVPKFFIDYLKETGSEVNVDELLRLSQKEMQDAASGVWIAPAWYEELCNKCKAEPNKKHVLFIDELTNVDPIVQSLVFHIVLRGSIGPNFGKLPENAVVVAAGNSLEESIAAYPMSEPLFRRFYGHVNIPLSFEEFKNWGIQPDTKNPGRQNIHPIILSFLDAKIPRTREGKESLSSSTDSVLYSKFDESSDKLYPIDPRGWEQISKIIYESEGQLRIELLENKLGANLAKEFLMFAIEEKAKGFNSIDILERGMSTDAQIRFYVENRMQFMLHGASGIGKSKRVEEIDPDLIAIHLKRGQLPEEIIGKTIYPNGVEDVPKWYDEYGNDAEKNVEIAKNQTKQEPTLNGGIWSPPPWYEALCKKCAERPLKTHVLFIDEITNVSPMEQSLVYHLVLNRSIGPNLGVLPENVVVVAAGNSIKESASAFPMPEPLYRRFAGHIYLKQDVEEWLSWARRKRPDGRTNIHSAVVSFVSMKKNKVFYSPYDSEANVEFAIDPRGWEQISDMLYLTKGEMPKEIIYNKLGKDLGSDFISTLNINQKITVPLIMSGAYDDQPKIEIQLSELFYLIPALANDTGIEEYETVRNFIATKFNVGNAEGVRLFDSSWASVEEHAIYLANKNKDKGMER